MKEILSGLSALLLLAACAGPGEEPAPDPAAAPMATDQAAAPIPDAAVPRREPPDCASVQPWSTASRALGQPVVQTTGHSGRAIYTIKNVSYAQIMMDRDLTGGVRLLDQTGREPSPNTVYNIVWTPDDVTSDYRSSDKSPAACSERYSAPTFIDVH